LALYPPAEQPTPTLPVEKDLHWYYVREITLLATASPPRCTRHRSRPTAVYRYVRVLR